jgi:hypothetical protein
MTGPESPARPSELHLLLVALLLVERPSPHGAPMLCVRQGMGASPTQIRWLNFPRSASLRYTEHAGTRCARIVGMKISGHKTRAVYDRYNITDERDIMEVGRKLNEKQNSNALLGIPFGQPSGRNSTKTAHSDDSEAAPLPALLPN